MNYQSLASVYDRLTEDVPYEEWASYMIAQFHRFPQNVHTVLDLCCGTGTLSCLLAERGYDLIGVDGSEDMLSIAMEKARRVTGNASPLFLHQNAEHLDLYGTVDACVSCLDSFNYLTMEQLTAAMERVHLFLEPGGLFLFDIRTPQLLRALDEQVFFDEREDLYCVWIAQFDDDINACVYSIDLFSLDRDALWRRSQETHVEYAHTPEEICDLLRHQGFTDICQYGNLTLAPPGEDEERIFFTARKGTSNP